MSNKKPDMINHPPHYNDHPAGIECIDVIQHMPHNLACAMKYIWREGLKGKSGEDLDKAIWYINQEKKRRKEFDVEV